MGTSHDFLGRQKLQSAPSADNHAMLLGRGTAPALNFGMSENLLSVGKLSQKKNQPEGNIHPMQKIWLSCEEQKLCFYTCSM